MWSGIVDSSIWDEEDYILKVFLTMLARKDADHIYRGNAYNLHTQSRKSEEQVLNALQVLSSPDTKRKEKQPYDGRRIKAVEEGWLILNGEKYRAQVALEMKRARNRKAQAAYRDRQKGSGETGPERRYGEAEKNGAPQAELDRLSEPGV